MKPEERTDDLTWSFGIQRGSSYGYKTKNYLLTSSRFAQVDGARTKGLGFRVVIDRGPANEIQEAYPKK